MRPGAKRNTPPPQPFGVVLPAKQVTEKTAVQKELARLTEAQLLESLPLFQRLVVLCLMRALELLEGLTERRAR